MYEIKEKIEELGEAVQGQKQGHLNASRTSKKEDFRRQVGKSDYGKWVQSVDWVTESWANRRFGGEESLPKVWIQAALVPTTFTESESAD